MVGCKDHGTQTITVYTLQGPRALLLDTGLQPGDVTLVVLLSGNQLVKSLPQATKLQIDACTVR